MPTGNLCGALPRTGREAKRVLGAISFDLHNHLRGSGLVVLLLLLLLFHFTGKAAEVQEQSTCPRPCAGKRHIPGCKRIPCAHSRAVSLSGCRDTRSQMCWRQNLNPLVLHLRLGPLVPRKHPHHGTGVPSSTLKFPLARFTPQQP